MGYIIINHHYFSRDPWLTWKNPLLQCVGRSHLLQYLIYITTYRIFYTQKKYVYIYDIHDTLMICTCLKDPWVVDDCKVFWGFPGTKLKHQYTVGWRVVRSWFRQAFSFSGIRHLLSFPGHGSGGRDLRSQQRPDAGSAQWNLRLDEGWWYFFEVNLWATKLDWKAGSDCGLLQRVATSADLGEFF